MLKGSLGLTLAIGLVMGAATARADEGGERERKGTADRDPSIVASTWFDELYDVIKSEATAAPPASRIYGISAVVIYEAVTPGAGHHRSLAAAGLGLRDIGLLAAIYPAIWGVGQLVTGGLSDRVGRKGLIVSGMWVQAAGIALIALVASHATFVVGSAVLGAGTAMVYPTLLAAIGDVAHPSWRASATGVYRLWRDLGYAAGALVSGVTADMLGARSAVGLVGGLTFASGMVVAVRTRETRRTRAAELGFPSGTGAPHQTVPRASTSGRS